jgi:hypothetical protein
MLRYQKVKYFLKKDDFFLKKARLIINFNNFSTMYCIIQSKTYIFVL